MQRSLITLAVVALLAGCGKRGEVYDVASNPDNFPPAALEILDRIESGELIGGDAIMSAFGNLYTIHSDLLDNDKWKEVINRLGSHFQKTADSLVGFGIGSLTLAGEYYQLGSFARPEDITLRDRANLFGCWIAPDENVKGYLDALNEPGYGLDAIVPITRDFAMGDSLHQQFFRSYLRDEFRKQISSANLLRDQGQDIKSADRAILVYAELADVSVLEPLTTFSPPRIDLVGARVSPLDTVEYRLELYFVPRVQIGEKLQVHIGVQSAQFGPAAVNIAPKIPTTEWEPDKVAIISRKIHCPGTLEAVGVGLCDFAVPEPRYILPQGEEDAVYLLRSTEMESQ